MAKALPDPRQHLLHSPALASSEPPGLLWPEDNALHNHPNSGDAWVEMLGTGSVHRSRNFKNYVHKAIITGGEADEPRRFQPIAGGLHTYSNDGER